MTAPWTLRPLAAALAAAAALMPVSIAGTNIALGLATAALLAHFRSEGLPAWRPEWTPAAAALVLYAAVGLLTSLTGVSPGTSLPKFGKDLHKLWAFSVLLLAFRAAPPWRRPLPWAAGFAFVAVFAALRSGYETYLSFYQGADFYGWHRVWVRARGFCHPVTFGEMMGLGLLGGLCFWLRTEDGRERRLQLAFCAALLLALLLSDTRGAFAGVLAGAAALCAALPQARRWLWRGLFVAVLGGLLLGLLPTDRSLVAAFRSGGTDPDLGQQFNRIALWGTAWRVFLDHPWLGVGTANFGTVFSQYYPATLEGTRVWTSAHNIVLHQMAERGIAGLGALLFLGWTLLAGAWQRVRAGQSPWNLWALSATAGFMVMNMTETAFHVEQVTTLFLAIWACSAARAGREPEGRRP